MSKEKIYREREMKKHMLYVQISYTNRKSEIRIHRKIFVRLQKKNEKNLQK